MEDIPNRIRRHNMSSDHKCLCLLVQCGVGVGVRWRWNLAFVVRGSWFVFNVRFVFLGIGIGVGAHRCSTFVLGSVALVFAGIGDGVFVLAFNVGVQICSCGCWKLAEFTGYYPLNGIGLIGEIYCFI
jgi:hypothetical protein